jgi:hypothetical protein
MVAHLGEESVEKSAALGSGATLSLPWWLSTSVILGALLMAAGGVIALVHPAMLVSAGTEINGATRVYAGYLVSRNLALAVMLLVMLSMRARGVLSTLMVLTAFIQLLDAGMDCMEGRWTLVPGVLIFAMVFFLGAARLSGQAFWKFAAWSDEAS